MQRRFVFVSILSLVGILLLGHMQKADAQLRARRAARGYYNSAPYNYGNWGNNGYWGNDGYWYSGSGPRTSGYWGDDGYWYEGPRSRQAFYPQDDSKAIKGNRARIIVRLPAANAQVWIDGQQTQQQGMSRLFDTPSLEPGTYSYKIRAKWRQNGRDMDQTRTISFQPGRTVTVDFNQSQDEDTGQQETEESRKQPNRRPD